MQLFSLNSRKKCFFTILRENSSYSKNYFIIYGKYACKEGKFSGNIIVSQNLATIST